MSVDRLIGGLFLFACLLLWFWIIPQQVVGEEQAFYPRLTVILVAIPAALMFLRNKGPADHPGLFPGRFRHLEGPCRQDPGTYPELYRFFALC